MIRLLPVATLLGGLAAGYCWPRPELVPLPEPERVAKVMAACDLGDMAETLQTLRAERTEGRARYEAVQAALVATVGAPEPWPEVAERFGEAAVGIDLGDILGEEFAVQSLDCSEYPCVALVELLGVDLDKRMAGQELIRGRLKEGGYAMGQLTTTMHSDGEQVDWRISATFTLPDPELPGDPERGRFRVREAGEFFE